jgi:predicted transcriptional regulator
MAMTSSERIPAEVRQFILTKIDSVPHLEALLLIWEQRTKTWTGKELARSLFIDQRAAKKIANDLLRRGWIKLRSEEQSGFVFDESWDPQEKMTKQLAETYRTKLVHVATLIHSNASVGVRDFAKAFDLKKE